MNNFRESYQQMMNDMPPYSIDVDSVLSEVRHKKAAARIRRQLMTSSFLTLCLLCLCGVGSAKAAGYFGNVIRVTNTGFATGDAVTMEDAAQQENDNMAKMSRKAAGSMESDAVQQENAGDCLEDMEGIVECREVVVLEPREYDSVETFRSAEPDAVLVLPDIPEEDGGIEDMRISVMDGRIMFYCRTREGRAVSLHVSDYTDSAGHASSIVYGDEIVNEREYITEAGYTYTLIDSVNEEQLYCGLHAAIAVGAYEIIADFWGYSEGEALSMIESMDLTAYIAGEK